MFSSSMAGRVHGMDSRIFCVCDDVKTLGWEGDDQAKEMLNRAANTVKPIMAKRKWRVAHLREFYPQNAALLGREGERSHCLSTF